MTFFVTRPNFQKMKFFISVDLEELKDKDEIQLAVSLALRLTLTDMNILSKHEGKQGYAANGETNNFLLYTLLS